MTEGKSERKQYRENNKAKLKNRDRVRERYVDGAVVATGHAVDFFYIKGWGSWGFGGGAGFPRLLCLISRWCHAEMCVPAKSAAYGKRTHLHQTVGFLHCFLPLASN